MKPTNCQYCSQSFLPKTGSFGKFCSLSCSTIFKNSATRVAKNEKYLEHPSVCKTCKSILPYDKRKNTYCTRSCAAKTTNAVPRKRGPTPKEKFKCCKVDFVLCIHTNKWYSNKNPDGSLRRCSPYIKTEKEKYYNAARFKFNVYHYPEEFDLSLIETHGWYTCPGKKRANATKNIFGVSRDHIISVSYGFNHKIDPAVIAHPANCRLLLHSENKKKHSKCDLTLDELLARIQEWDRKYSERCIGLEPMTSNLEG